MKPNLAAAVFLTAMTFAFDAASAERRVTLKVENMTCELCAPTVKKSLSQVKGVIRVEVSTARQIATVTFDDAEADATALTTATKNAGYPSRLVQ